MAESRQYDELTDEQLHAIETACTEFERALKTAEPVSIESLLPAVPIQIRMDLFRELLSAELEARIHRGQAPSVAEYEIRFPNFSVEIRRAFAETEEQFASSNNSMQILTVEPSMSVGRTHTKSGSASDNGDAIERIASSGSQETVEQLPRNIGRYRLEQIIGQGAFGVVYRAYDEQLNRVVAVKTPHASTAVDARRAKAYLTEAQIIAGLDHPNIVPVYDFGSTDTVSCYIVLRFIDGGSLSARLKRGPMSFSEAATLAAEITGSLQAAHRQGLIHRDVKPGNILIDSDGKAWLTDFGLALHHDNTVKGPKLVGTPAYMSPEQARGEEHRIDGRSDIFSLGAVLYEMLTGRPPFRASTQTELLHRIATTSPRPLRQCDEHIPKELERICLKALSHRASDRFAAAHDMAESLREFLREFSSQRNSHAIERHPSLSLTAGSIESNSAHRIPSRGSHDRSDPDWRLSGDPIKVVPKGLSSFDGHDSDFFLELLPGPRDRHGLPDSIRFWKHRIEATDANSTFSVGLIYGPSGCGKSSLIKAGLIPRLSFDVTVVYVEATDTETENLLLRRLRNDFSALPKELNLTEALMALRHEIVDSTGPKLLIVLDQFEQWLNANKDAKNTDLVNALRQCDGTHVQCIVMVRDDFWLAVSRFLQDLEIDAIPGRNVALVDLFGVEHATFVLASFGRAFGRLPESSVHFTKDQKTFLIEAVQGLAEDGKIVSVRLSLFAEMMKDKPWTPAALKEIGGADGIGVAFLEDAFRSSAAFPKHRLHQVAARRVLEELLPESGTDIKGSMRSSENLLAASGYASRTRDFDELIHVLDSELRLITPTEAVEPYGERQDVSQPPQASSFYQLTHDYLVPSLRIWLTQKQTETRQGRAELLLAERFALWNRKPENRNLPSAWEWLMIRLLTDRSLQTPPQRHMMRQARRVQGMRWGIGFAITMVIGIAAMLWVSSVRYNNLVDRMYTAVDTVANSSGPVVPLAIENLNAFPKDLIVSCLESRFVESNASQKLPLACAMARYGRVDIDFLIHSTYTAPVDEVNNLAEALAQSLNPSVIALRRASVECESDKNWSRKHRLAVLALQMGDASIASDMCQIRSDRLQRLDFILAWPTWHGDLANLSKYSTQLTDPSLRSGLMVGLGNVRPEDVTRETQQTWHPILLDWFGNSEDAAVHSAAEWLLNRWDLPVPPNHSAQVANEKQNWHVTKNGITIIRIPAGRFQRRYGYLSKFAGAPEFLTAPLQTVTLTRRILVSDREISVRQFQQMMDDKNYDEKEKALHWHSIDPISSPTPDHPAQFVSWNDAVRFCNWLSHTEGFVPAYERTGNVWTIPPSGKTPGDFEEWRLVERANGYRLPTNAEWEYLCRAGCDTQDPFGDAVNTRFLQAFASSRTRLVSLDAQTFNAEKCASQPPNAWGIFDLHGNVVEWCHDWAEAFPGHGTPDVDSVSDPTGPTNPDPLLYKQIRDGIFYRTFTALTVGSGHRGFRVVRTIE